MKPHFPSARAVDALAFKHLFRHADRHGVVEGAEVEGWLRRWDNRNTTAPDYGVGFAEETLICCRASSRMPGVSKNGCAMPPSLDLAPHVLERLRARGSLGTLPTPRCGPTEAGSAAAATRAATSIWSYAPSVPPGGAPTQPGGAPRGADRKRHSHLVEVLDWARLPDRFRAEMLTGYAVVREAPPDPLGEDSPEKRA